MLTWTANTEPDLARYRVLRDGALVATVTGSTSYTDAGLTNDTTYSYSLVAVDTHGNASPASAPPVSATPTDLTPPAVPTGVREVRGDQSVALSWNANTEPDLASYRVLRDGVEIATVIGATDFTDSGLTNYTTYVYTLVAVDTHGNRSAPSAPSSSTPTDLTPPAVPTGLVATRGDGRVTLSWTANTESDLASYRVLRDGVEVATVTGSTGYLDAGLVNDRTYAYALVSVDVEGNRSAASSPAVPATPTDLTPPAMPTGFTGTSGDGQVTLTWTANTDGDLAGYVLRRDGVDVASLSGTSYTDTGLVNDRVYRYTLVAFDGHANRSAESPAVTLTPTDLSAPAVPTGLAATSGDGQVVLTWTANTESDLAGYVLRRDGVDVAAVTGTSYTDTGLVNGTTYSYTLVAVDTHGNRSAASSPSVSATPTDQTAPEAPTGLVATPGDGQVSLSWTANTEPDLASYRVLRDGVEIATVSGTSYTDAGLVNDTTYSYTLVAVDSGGNRSVPSPTVTGTPTDLTPPAAPTGLVATRGDGGATLSWTANTEPDLASYRVLRDGVEIATVTGASFTDTGLTQDTAYRYTLVAVDTHGNRSLPSTGVDVTPTDLTPPAAPTGLVATRGDGQVLLSWTANTDPDLADYVLQRDGVDIASLSGTSYPDTGLVNDQPYSYTLVAFDAHGNRSAPSPVVTATPTDLTPPAAPTGLVVTGSENHVSLSWTANTESDLASYRVLRDGVEIATVTGTTYDDTSVTQDITYRYTLVAVDTHGNRSLTSAGVDATPTDLTAPAAPADVVATAGERQVGLSWTASPESDVAGYRVLRDGVQIATSTGPSTVLTGLAPGVAVDLTVVAVDVHGNVSDPSATVTATPYDHTAPAVPTGVTGQPGNTTATISWQPVSDVDVVGYRVLRDGVQVATESGTSTTVTGLTNGTSYGFTVVAVDPYGNASAASVSVTVVPVAPAAGTVPATGSGETGGLAASRDGRFVVIGTRAPLDPSDTNTAYELYVLDRTAGAATRIAPLPANATGAGDCDQHRCARHQQRRPVRGAGHHGSAAAGRHQQPARRLPLRRHREDLGAGQRPGRGHGEPVGGRHRAAERVLHLRHEPVGGGQRGRRPGALLLRPQRPGAGGHQRRRRRLRQAHVHRCGHPGVDHGHRREPAPQRHRTGAGADPGRPVRALPGHRQQRPDGAVPQDAVRRRGR